MAIDPHAESLVTLSEACRLVPSHPALPTVWRWVLHGMRGIYLDSIVIGARRYTSIEAIDRYMAATDRAARPEARREATAQDRRRRSAAERDAVALGL